MGIRPDYKYGWVNDLVEPSSTIVSGTGWLYEPYGIAEAPEIIPEIKNVFLGQWKPVNDEMPPEGEMVLVTCCTKKGVRSVNRAYYMDGAWHGSGSMSGVTAWMPLPIPFEEEDNDF